MLPAITMIQDMRQLETIKATHEQKQDKRNELLIKLLRNSIITHGEISQANLL